MKKAIKKGRVNNKTSTSEMLYSNRFLLDKNNQTDYFMYLKYPEKRSEPVYNLNQAYLVPAEPLRHRIIDILNIILKKGNSDQQVQIREYYLNHRIMEAYSIVKDEPMPPITEINLFRARKNKYDTGDIVLRIPEQKLTSYIKFDNEGHIISTTT